MNTNLDTEKLLQRFESDQLGETCPVCNRTIPPTVMIEHLTTGKPMRCTICGARIRVDAQGNLVLINFTI